MIIVKKSGRLAEISDATRQVRSQGLYLAIYRDGDWCVLEPGHFLPRTDLLCTIVEPMHEPELREYLAYCMSLPGDVIPWDVLEWRSMRQRA